MRLKIYIYGLLIVTLVSACNNEIIEIEPENAVTPEVALKRVSGINGLILSAYRRLHEFSYYGQQHILNAEALADNLVIANNTGRYTGHVVNAVNSHSSALWNNGGAGVPWQIINDCNIVLVHVDAAEPALSVSGTLAGFPESEEIAAAKRTRYKGEAYFLRALAYHDLAKAFGYEPGREVNGFKPSVILRTTPTESVTLADKRARATNDEIYAQIESDLLSAIDLLPAETDFIGSTTVPAQQWATTDKYFRASKAAAKALLSRVYLYWNKFAEANTMATAVMTAGDPGASDRTIITAATYVASWSATRHPESIFEAEIRTADWSSVDGVNNSLASITNSSPTGASNAQFAVAGSPELMAAFEPGDIRRSVWITNAGRNESKKWQGEKGTFLENIPLIRISEVALIAAEARARSGDEPGARTILNSLRTNRGLTATVLTGQALLDLILNERRVELAFEGHRFFDLKRLGLSITKPVSLGISDVPYSDFRILSNIPNAEVTYNEKLLQNPNY